MVAVASVQCCLCKVHASHQHRPLPLLALTCLSAVFCVGHDAIGFARSVCPDVKEYVEGYNDAEYLVDLVTEADHMGKGGDMAAFYAASQLKQVRMSASGGRELGRRESWVKCVASDECMVPCVGAWCTVP